MQLINWAADIIKWEQRTWQQQKQLRQTGYGLGLVACGLLLWLRVWPGSLNYNLMAAHEVRGGSGDGSLHTTFMALSPDNKYLAMSEPLASNGKITLLDRLTHSTVKVLTAPDSTAWHRLSFILASRQLVAFNAQDVEVWDVANSALLHRLDLTALAPLNEPVYPLGASPNGLGFWVGRATELQIFSLSSDGPPTRPVSTWNLSGVRQAKFSPDGRWVLLWRYGLGSTYVAANASSSGDVASIGDAADNAIELHDAATGLLQQSFPNGKDGVTYDCSFTPDSQYVRALSSSDGLKVWDIATHRPVQQVAGLARVFQGSYAYAFSPDGKYLAVGMRSHAITSSQVDHDAPQASTIEVWSATAGCYQHTLSGFHDTVYNLDWTPDSRQLIATSSAGVFNWDFDARE